jgi:hypothetical protein
MTRIELSAGTVEYGERAAGADTYLLLAAADHLSDFRRPARLLPQGRLVEIGDSHTLIPLDRPAELARVVREFTDIFDTTRRSGRSVAAPPRSGDDRPESEDRRETGDNA